MDLSQSTINLGAAGALISAVGTSVALALRARSRERLTAIQGAPAEERALLVADAIAMFKISTDGLTKEQRYDLVVRQLEDRNRQRNRLLLATITLMALLTGATITLALQDSAQNKDNKTPTSIHQSTTGGINNVGDSNSITNSVTE